MATATGDRKVSDLTVNDLRRLIRDTIYLALKNLVLWARSEIPGYA